MDGPILVTTALKTAILDTGGRPLTQLGSGTVHRRLSMCMVMAVIKAVFMGGPGICGPTEDATDIGRTLVLPFSSHVGRLRLAVAETSSVN